MIVRYSRIPAMLVLMMTITGISYYVRGSLRKHAGTERTLEQLEAAIKVNKTDMGLWKDYAKALMAAEQYEKAAKAWEQVMDRDPTRENRVGYARALAKWNGDKYYDFLRDQVHVDAKLTQEMMEWPESQGYMDHDRFRMLYKDAQAQAAD
jgi:tetratricopeptide (TPR) repeat protein